MGKYFNPEVIPDPATYLFTETLLRYEAVIAMYRTRLTKTMMIGSLQYVFYCVISLTHSDQPKTYRYGY